MLDCGDDLAYSGRFVVSLLISQPGSSIVINAVTKMSIVVMRAYGLLGMSARQCLCGVSGILKRRYVDLNRQWVRSNSRKAAKTV